MSRIHFPQRAVHTFQCAESAFKEVYSLFQISHLVGEKRYKMVEKKDKEDIDKGYAWVILAGK